jgi:hypothetical protein
LFNARLQPRRLHEHHPVTITAILTLLPTLFGMTAMGAPDDGPRVSSLIAQDELIMRIPVNPRSGKVEWVEYQGPQCIAARAITGAFLSGSDSVDFITVKRRRFRAELSRDCPALDYYEGIYVRPDDHRVCAKRDVIRSRMGGSCRIERFMQLVPKPGG